MASSPEAVRHVTTAMNLWRISSYETLDGEGGRHYPGRWHEAGHPVVYLAESDSGALLETLVHLHLDAEDLPPSYKLLRVSVPAGREYVRLLPSDDAWQKNISLTQEIGQAWLNSKASALAAVPSSLTPRATNWLLNPEHRDATSIRIVEVLIVEYDERLLRVRLAAQSSHHPA